MGKIRKKYCLYEPTCRYRRKTNDELYEIIEKCSPGPHLELFARGTRKKWAAWGNQAKNYDITVCST
jgi:N6-adenosine-specific RNA methylase IME4